MVFSSLRDVGCVQNLVIPTTCFFNPKSISSSVLKNSLQKVIGANQVIIKLNPIDYNSITTSEFIPEIESSFNKIKFEEDSKIELGGCIINTELGNVDAKISNMINELIRKLENSVEQN